MSFTTQVGIVSFTGYPFFFNQSLRLAGFVAEVHLPRFCDWCQCSSIVKMACQDHWTIRGWGNHQCHARWKEDSLRQTGNNTIITMVKSASNNWKTLQRLQFGFTFFTGNTLNDSFRDKISRIGFALLSLGGAMASVEAYFAYTISFLWAFVLFKDISSEPSLSRRKLVSEDDIGIFT